MIPAAFDYVRADSVDAALGALTEYGDEAKLLAGGHSLLPLMKLRLAAPSVLVDVGRLDDLRYITDAGDHIAIGALTRHRDLEISSLLDAQAPLLSHAASHVGDPQVRHRGTLGGSLAHADPASDLPAVILAMGGSLVATGPNGTRTIPASEFFTGFLESALAPDELLTEIRIPKLETQGWSSPRFNRRAQDLASVAVATDAVLGMLHALGVRPGPPASRSSTWARLPSWRAPWSMRSTRVPPPPTPPLWPPREPKPRAISTPQRTIASIWLACWCVDHSKSRDSPDPKRVPPGDSL